MPAPRSLLEIRCGLFAGRLRAPFSSDQPRITLVIFFCGPSPPLCPTPHQPVATPYRNCSNPRQSLSRADAALCPVLPQPALGSAPLAALRPAIQPLAADALSTKKPSGARRRVSDEIRSFVLKLLNRVSVCIPTFRNTPRKCTPLSAIETPPGN